MGAFEFIPKGRNVTASITRRGALAAIAGVSVLSVSMFTDAPLPLLLLITIGGLLILAACLAGVVIALLSPFRGER